MQASSSEGLPVRLEHDLLGTFHSSLSHAQPTVLNSVGYHLRRQICPILLPNFRVTLTVLSTNDIAGPAGTQNC